MQLQNLQPLPRQNVVAARLGWKLLIIANVGLRCKWCLIAARFLDKRGLLDYLERSFMKQVVPGGPQPDEWGVVR
jgi:hypothetical protein